MSVVRIPRIWFRVVCGFGVTIANFCPKIALSSVDFPDVMCADNTNVTRFEVLDFVHSYVDGMLVVARANVDSQYV